MMERLAALRPPAYVTSTRLTAHHPSPITVLRSKLLLRHGERSPVGGLRHYPFEGGELDLRDARGAQPDRWPALPYFARRLHHDAPELDDGEIARPQPFLAAVHDGTHAFPHRDVLIGKTTDAGEVAELHRLAVLQVVVLAVPELPVLRVEIDADLRAAELAPRLLLYARLVRPRPGDHVEDRVGVVQRDVHQRQVVHVVRRDERGERRDEDRDPYIIVGGGVHDGTPDRRVAEAEARALRLQARRPVGGRARP